MVEALGSGLQGVAGGLKGHFAQRVGWRRAAVLCGREASRRSGVRRLAAGWRNGGREGVQRGQQAGGNSPVGSVPRLRYGGSIFQFTFRLEPLGLSWSPQGA